MIVPTVMRTASAVSRSDIDGGGGLRASTAWPRQGSGMPQWAQAAARSQRLVLQLARGTYSETD